MKLSLPDFSSSGPTVSSRPLLGKYDMTMMQFVEIDVIRYRVVIILPNLKTGFNLMNLCSCNMANKMQSIDPKMANL